MFYWGRGRHNCKVSVKVLVIGSNELHTVDIYSNNK